MFLNEFRLPAMAGWACATMIFLLGGSANAAALSKGHQLLLRYGLQLQGSVQWDDYFHLNTYTNAHYNSINWTWNSTPELLSATAGSLWSRWVSGTTNMPPQNGEGPYLTNLVALQLGDEWNLQDTATRNSLINWFVAVRNNWPNTILFHNNYGGQASDAALADFIPKAKPDMLFFDVYPFQSVWDVNAPNHIGPPIPGPFTGWFSELRRYRQWAIDSGIPFGAWMQTFHSVQDYDQHVYRNPSASELRLNNFGALAFNAKMLTGFRYNAGATSLFDILPNGYSGDLYTNALYGEQADVNLRAGNLGKALVRLQPIADAASTDQHTTSIMFVRGRTPTGGIPDDIPIGLIADPQAPNSYTDWVYQQNDPYLAGWVVTNKAGIKNGGYPGDVIISWFKPLDESFDGPTYSNEVYLMVVNALTDTNGTPADCMQEIKLNFNFGTSGLTAVNMLDPLTGKVTTNTLPIVSTRRQLVLDLNGGDAALFKFADGAPFVGVTPLPPRVNMRTQAGTSTIGIDGLVGVQYQLQSTSSLSSANWTTVTNVVLPSSPFWFLSVAPTNSTQAFYRALGPS